MLHGNGRRALEVPKETAETIGRPSTSIRIRQLPVTRCVPL